MPKIPKKKAEKVVLEPKLEPKSNPLQAELFAISMLILTGLLGVSFFEGQKIAKQNENIEVAKQIDFANQNPFRTLSLGSKAVLVYDLDTNKILYSKKSKVAYPLASVAKLMTATVALENMNEDDVVSVDQDSISQEGSSGLLRDEKWKLRDLINIMLVESSNDAAHAIAKTVGTKLSGNDNNMERFIGAMNEKAKELGLTKTVFYNESGLDVTSEKSGAYGSAEDIAKLIAYFGDKYPEYSKSTESETFTAVSLNNISHTIKNTNTSISELRGLEASKTGYTKLAGGNLAVIINPDGGNHLAVVVLGGSEQGRFSDTIQLVASAVQYKDLAVKSGISLDN